MEMHSNFESSNIRAYGYDDEEARLRVVYHNEHYGIITGTYDYFNVPRSIYEALRRAESKGTFINFYVKRMYKFQKVDK
jgi:hypothetical protein